MIVICNTDGFTKLSTDTYNKMKNFVIRGGVIFDQAELGSYRHYSYANDTFSISTNYVATHALGAVANMVQDLGGINPGLFGRWKNRNFQSAAINNDRVVNSVPSKQVMASHGGMDILPPEMHQNQLCEIYYPHHGYGVVLITHNEVYYQHDGGGHASMMMWDGSVSPGDHYQTSPGRHFRTTSATGTIGNTVKGKIIMNGDTNWGPDLQSHIINPLLDYTARTRQR